MNGDQKRLLWEAKKEIGKKTAKPKKEEKK
jgi:hypothetical protein